MPRVVIIGGGHNGLVAAFYLARAGLKPLVLERRETVGGAVITGEIHPGYRCPTLSHAAGPLRADIARDMRLDRHGLRPFRPDPHVFAPAPDGRALVLYQDAGRSAGEIRRFSAKDAVAYPAFQESIRRIAGLLDHLRRVTPPSIDRPSAGDLWSLLGVGRRFRALGRTDAYRFLRWGPMAVADLVGEWFETELLRATLAARGIFGASLGPWSAGSGAMMLLQAANHDGSATASVFVEGGAGALTQAMAAAARQAGAEIRTGAPVKDVRVKDERVAGVVLESGEEISASTVISNADPRRTFLTFVDPIHLTPDFVTKIRNYRATGIAAKVNLALAGLPRFTALSNGAAEALGGRIHIGPEIDYLERAFDAAKYGECSSEPYLDVTIPSLADPSLAPAGRHVMSIYMQFAPYTLKAGTWATERDRLADRVIRTLARYAPNLPDLIVERQVITPLDLEQVYGLTGGHIFHGEPSLDQLFTMRPLLGWARYRAPIEGLYLCGAGTHPGPGITGASGANASREMLKDLRTKSKR